QSTRLSNAGFGGGAGAGLDDRFDFILISENILNSPELKYIDDTYKAFGNNGNCLNNRIDSPDCDGEYSFELRNNLYWMSDHLPVIMELETDRVFLTNPTVSIPDLITFPKGNLADTYLTVQVHSSIQEQAGFKIYNILGQKMAEIQSNNLGEYTIDVAGFTKGIYYLNSTANNTTYKFIKR